MDRVKSEQSVMELLAHLAKLEEYAIDGKITQIRARIDRIRQELRAEQPSEREKNLEEALRKISEPDQGPLRAALRTNDELRIIQAVTHALNWCRDTAKEALLSGSEPLTVCAICKKAECAGHVTEFKVNEPRPEKAQELPLVPLGHAFKSHTFLDGSVSFFCRHEDCLGEDRKEAAHLPAESAHQPDSCPCSGDVEAVRAMCGCACHKAEPAPQERCDWTIEPNDLQYRCTLTKGHGRDHVSGMISWTDPPNVGESVIVEHAQPEPPAQPAPEEFDAYSGRLKKVEPAPEATPSADEGRAARIVESYTCDPHPDEPYDADCCTAPNRESLRNRLLGVFAAIRREERTRGMDACLNAHGVGQESTIRDANAGLIDDMLQPLIDRVRRESSAHILELETLAQEMAREFEREHKRLHATALPDACSACAALAAWRDRKGGALDVLRT